MASKEERNEEQGGARELVVYRGEGVLQGGTGRKVQRRERKGENYTGKGKEGRGLESRVK